MVRLMGSGNFMVDAEDRDSYVEPPETEQRVACGYCCKTAVSNPCAECTKVLAELDGAK